MRGYDSKSCEMCFRAFVLLSILLVSLPSFAGTLSDFETDATKKDHSEKKAEKRNEASSGSDDVVSDIINDSCSELCVPLGQGIVGNLIRGMAAGGAQSLERVNADSLAAQKNENVSRKGGEALIPFIRLDSAYQKVESDVTAWDYRLELGYGSVGLQVRRTVYDEKVPVASLEMVEYHALYRMSFGSHFETDLGGGAITLNGSQKNSGISFTVPVLYHPSDLYGFELRPVWSSINGNGIQDFDVAALFGRRYASVRAGYRWVRSPHQSLDGPEIGVSLRW